MARGTDRRRRKLRSIIAVVSAAALLLAACGGDDGEGSTDTDTDTDAATDSGTEEEAADETGEEEAGDSDDESRYGGTIRVAYEGDPVTLDNMAFLFSPHAPKRAVFETLYGLDAGLNPHPVLATDHEISEDGLTWTISIQEGVLFHDGSEMTSEDVVASWDRFDQVGVKRDEVDAIDTVTTAGDYAVELQLSRPNAGLLSGLAPANGHWSIHPKEIMDEVGTGDMEAEHWTGTGPYQYVEHEPDGVWVFERYEDYWGGPEGEPNFMAGERNAYVDRVEVESIADPQTRVSALLAGEIDMALVPPDDVANIDALKEASDIEITRTNPGRNVNIKMNPRIPPFDDPILREAVRTGVNLESLMAAFGPEELWRTKCTPRFMEGQWPFIDRCDHYPQDMERALELVEESDYDGQEVTLMVSPSRADQFPIAVPLEAYLRELGLNVTMDVVDGPTWTERYRDLDSWNIKPSGGGIGGAPQSLAASSYDRNGDVWPNLLEDEWDEAMAAATNAETQEEALTHIATLYDIIEEMDNEIILGEVFFVAGHHSSLQGVSEFDTTLGFVNAWWDD